jgi:class 3 adenylate cyclase
LQRDISVNKDRAHEWGTSAFHCLPERARTQQAQDQSQCDASELEPEIATGTVDDHSVISEQIKNLSIPGIRNSVLLQLFLFILFQVAGIPLFLIIGSMLEEKMLEPLAFFRSMGILRTGGYLMASLAQQVIYTRMTRTDGIVVVTPPPTTAILPQSVGGSWDVGEQLNFWSRLVAATLQDAMAIRTFDSANENIKNAQHILFDPIHRFTYYDSGYDKPSYSDISLHVALINIVNQQTTILAIRNSTAADVSEPPFLNTMTNIPELCPQIQQAIDDFIVYVQVYNDGLTFIFSVAAYSALGLGAVLVLIALVLEIVWIRGNKEKVYTCLTALPKNNVSAIAGNLRVRKRDSEESSASTSETNKQDDNIMKVFVAGGSSGMGTMLDQIEMILCVTITVVLYVVCLTVVPSAFRTQSENIASSAPQITYLQGAWGVCMAAMSDYFQMFWLKTDYANPLVNKSFLLSRFNWNTERFSRMYVNVRFGNQDLGIPPYIGYPEGSAEARARIECSDEAAVPHSFGEASQCYPPDVIYGMVESFLKARTWVLEQNGSMEHLIFDVRIQQMYALMISPIYDFLVEPMFVKIEGTIRADLGSNKSSVFGTIIGLLIGSAVFEILALMQIRRMEIHMRRTLELLLHCPAAVIVQCPKVMTVLGGDFSTRRRDETAKTSDFFRSVVMQMPDAILTVATETMTIVSANAAADRTFGEGLVGQNITDFLTKSFQGNVEAIAKTLDAKGATEELMYQKGTESSLNIETTVLPMGDTTVYIFRDVTTIVRYNTLIQFERSKSDSMLRSILPPSLVPRVQAGEKNISFAVSSASIVFLDIVSFTPWCGSNPADRVMMTLNNLFRRLDVCCNSYSTMTRIKCIGDCYMAAGGVFSEVNQPVEHAKQVVSFGLDSIHSVVELNVELHENLQIRVGVNTGGPIVAGVLGGGVGKPTFEILGPSINMAQQMEHHGVPMQVHVSRAVYELIYGDQFIVKERGGIEVKQGLVVTYLVTGRTGPKESARPADAR